MTTTQSTSRIHAPSSSSLWKLIPGLVATAIAIAIAIYSQSPSQSQSAGLVLDAFTFLGQQLDGVRQEAAAAQIPFGLEKEEAEAGAGAGTISVAKMGTRPSMENLNVLKKPLALFSKQPLTGFYRDGYCRVGPEDRGNHAVAGVVTKEFLDYSASKGNDLRTVGLTDGCKWCLCTSRWKEALNGFKSGEIGEGAVPKVFLHATDQSALDKVSMDDLKQFAAPGEAASPEKAPLNPSSKPSAPIKEI